VNPALPLIAALRDAGTDLLVYSSPAFENQVAATGAEFRSYPDTTAAEQFASHTGKLGFLARSLAALNIEIFESELDAVRQLDPDFIVHDSLAIWGKHIALAIGKPAICMSAMLIPTRATRRLARRSGYRMGGIAEIAASTRHSFAAVGLGIRFHRRTGLRTPTLFDFFLAYEPLNVVCTSREFQPGVDELDASWIFARPELGEDRTAGDPAPMELPDDRPVVLLSAGTVFSVDLDYFRLALSALADSDVFVVASSGGAFEPEALGGIPPNAVVRSNIPFLDTLRRSRLIIGHGGIGSVSKAFDAGVPAIIVPQVLEQATTGRRAEELGAAICIPRHKLTPGRLRDAVQRILKDESYRESAARIGKTFAATDGMDVAARRILDYVDSGSNANAPAGAGAS